MRLSRFWIWTIGVPLVLAGLAALLIHSPMLGSNVTGPYAGLAVAVMARAISYWATVLIFVVGALGLLYTLAKARLNWRYYALSLAFPALLVGWWAFGLIQQQALKNNPEYIRYQANVAMCDGMYSSLMKYYVSPPSEDPDYADANKEKFTMQDFDARSKELYDLSGPLWKSDGICNDVYMTEAEAIELRGYFDKHLDLQQELSLAFTDSANRKLVLHIQDLEAQGGRFACDYASSADMVNAMLPLCVIDANGVASVKWVDQGDGTEMSTQEVLDSL